MAFLQAEPEPIAQTEVDARPPAGLARGVWGVSSWVPFAIAFGALALLLLVVLGPRLRRRFSRGRL